MSNIQRDLAFGRAAEDRVVKLYKESGFDSSIQPNKGKFSDYDIESSCPMKGTVLSHNFTTEVKHDAYAARSGNIAIEMFNPKSGKPSGLMATKADLWVHIISNGVYIANAKRLKKWVNDTPAKRIISAGGDGNATLYLYSIDVIFDKTEGSLFTEIDELDSDSRREVIFGCLNEDLRML